MPRCRLGSVSDFAKINCSALVAKATAQAADGKAAIDKAQAATDRIAADEAAADKIVADKVAADTMVADKIAADRMVADKMAADKAAAGKAAADKAAADKVAADKIVADKAAAVKRTRRPWASAQAAAAAMIIKLEKLAAAAVGERRWTRTPLRSVCGTCQEYTSRQCHWSRVRRRRRPTV